MLLCDGCCKNATTAFTGITVAASAVLTVNFKATSKHASSSGYAIQLVAFQLRRTA